MLKLLTLKPLPSVGLTFKLKLRSFSHSFIIMLTLIYLLGLSAQTYNHTHAQTFTWTHAQTHNTKVIQKLRSLKSPNRKSDVYYGKYIRNVQNNDPSDSASGWKLYGKSRREVVWKYPLWCSQHLDHTKNYIHGTPLSTSGIRRSCQARDLDNMVAVEVFKSRVSLKMQLLAVWYTVER